MSKGRRANPKGRNVSTERFVMLYRYMLESEAYRSLKPKARALYVEIKRFYNGNNNGDVFMSIEKAAELLGVWGNTSARALDELQEKGFIRPHVIGSFHRKVRHATTWILTEHEYNGQLATKDFMRWRKDAKI